MGIQKNPLPTGLSRRSLLAGAGGLVIGLYLLPKAAKFGFGPAAAAENAPSVEPNAFLHIAPDDTVTVLVKHIECGQGPLTGLSTLVAEELDADWSQMRAEHAPSNAELYKNFAFGIQGTGGSTAIANSYEQMRQAGASARALLIAAAAEKWGVSPKEITVEKGVISHPSGKEGRFGEFAEAAAKLPAPVDVPLKKRADFRLIGSDDGTVKRLDSEAKSTGKALFTLDAREEGQLTVVVAHPPRFGAKVASFDDSEARKVRGVVDVKQIPTGVAVYAESTWPAIKARRLLEIEWDESGAETRGTEEMISEWRAMAQEPGKQAGARGDAAAVLSGADEVVETEYVFPYLAHAPMEPLDGTLAWDGETALARFGSQLQTVDHMTIAKTLGIDPSKLTLETVFGGGTFGRRAQPDSHLAAELAQVAKAIGPNRPVKLVWTREDDIQGGYYRPLTLHRLRGAVKDGKIAAWSQTVVTQSIMAGGPFEAMIQDGIDPTSVEGAREIPYAIADFRCDLHDAEAGVPVLWWRSVGHTHTGYAVECFVDELLEKAGLDPVEGRLAMMGEHPREAGALRAVAELADWKNTQPAEGRARGVAVVKSFSSYVAQIAEVSLDEEGLPKVHKVWCAVDCGVAVNPDNIRAQMQSGIGYGLGHILYSEIPMEDGRVVPTNFDEYRSLRIQEMPEIEVTIVESDEAPTGVGEPGLPPLGPAVANAMARLGVKRPTRLPMVRGAA